MIKIHLPKGLKHNQPKKIVLHTMAEFINYDGEDMYAPYFLRKIGLSAHSLITPIGQEILCRYPTEGAYHAKGHNTDSLGLEFLMQGVHTYESFLETLKTPYLSAAAFDKGVEVVKGWMDKFDIPIEEVVTHQEIDPDRKYDPGTGFPLEEFKNELSHA